MNFLLNCSKIVCFLYFAASLVSSIDEVRGHISLSVAMLAKKITDAKALKELVYRLFRTYSGLSSFFSQACILKKVTGIIDLSLGIKRVWKCGEVSANLGKNLT